MRLTLGLTVLLLCCAVFVRGQASSEKTPDLPNPAAQSGDANIPAPSPETILDLEAGARSDERAAKRSVAEQIAEHSGCALEGMDVLNDPMGANLEPYLRRVMTDIRLNWFNLIPEVARPPIMKRAKVTIQFAILRDGTVAGMTLNQFSGDVSLDRAAWGGISLSNPLPPLPKDFAGNYLILRLRFFYNAMFTGISPCRDVQVAVGSTQKFTPTFTHETALDWSVTGPGCTKESCGTVTEAGLYTAPRVVPNPPTVKVIATAKSDLGEAASALVTVIASPPK